ncbi:3-keto-5-aminohexanoate cleavage protein [Bradyrhizobium sp. 2TAF24]|uniref:3-keto-5-aminohexanoate cleavage protein n=1 Tax=Bradyrhizobium sp. 2TAF24 TaxID=3233011 RepID=UPI003F912258
MISPLSLMVAPNGARKSPADHPNLPVTIDAIATTAGACRDAGAQALHLHVRDDAGRHTLDAARYLAATAAVRRAAGEELVVQITTEAVGIFKPHEQMAAVRAVVPEAVSIAPKELIPDAGAEAEAAAFYGWAHRQGIAVQHIVYAPAEFDWLLDLIGRGIVPGARHSVIFPLGRYAADQESDPAELAPFVARLREQGGVERFDWWVCAFGRAETASLIAAAALGGHCRVGFENSFFNADGSRAGSNAERVANVQAAASGLRRPPATRAATLRLLGRPE